MTVAILGGGILGSCTALELADRGEQVVLFERNPEPLAEASLHNEGKLHLGYVYAADRSFRTAERMIGGAARFFDTLARWIPAQELGTLPARPFDYVVHRDTMVSVEEIETHFARVADCVAARTAGARFAPTDPTRPAWRRLSGAELEERYDPAGVRAAYETNEIAVDPWGVAQSLRCALAAHPRVDVRVSTLVERADVRADGRLDVLVRSSEAGARTDETRRDGPFDAVLNALWANRPLVDQRFGMPTGDAWYTRYKVGVNFVLAAPPAAVPSFTVMLGPFGDVVAYRSGRVYLSWYPSCLLGTSTRVEHIDWTQVLAAADHDAIRRETIGALAALCPHLAELASSSAEVRVNGGAIFALGHSDIHDPASRLHERAHHGVSARDRYLSVDTAKYTLGPAIAVDTAARLAELVGAARRGAVSTARA